ncbi:MAG: hypothetical protein KUG77_25595 [Nannocystaceae bacterium]|nr:hypothetical protein [Nannocystaceae bacterium]
MFVLLACGKEELSEPTRMLPPSVEPPGIAVLPVEPVFLDARPGAASPRLTAGASGAVLSWLERDGDGLRLRARSWGQEGATQTVVSGGSLLQNWADLPSVVPGPNGWVAAWPQRRDAHGYDLQWSSRGQDGSWTPPVAVSDALEGQEFGFISWAASPQGALSAFWLDGRASTTSHGGAMQLWTARVSAEGMLDRRMLDDRVCDCRQTAAVSTARGPVVVYRDRDENEIRDIWVAGPGPQQRRRVGLDDWRIEGCPVNGPSISVSENTLAVAWFSGASTPGHVHVAFATDDQPFSEPIVVDDGSPLGRTDLVWVDGDSVAVVWMERVQAGAEVRIRRVSRTGWVSAPLRVASTEASRQAGFPHVERVGPELALAWVELSSGTPSIAAATASIAALPKNTP